MQAMSYKSAVQVLATHRQFVSYDVPESVARFEGEMVMLSIVYKVKLSKVQEDVRNLCE